MGEYGTEEIFEDIKAKKYPILMKDSNTDTGGSVNSIQRKTYLDIS